MFSPKNKKHNPFVAERIYSLSSILTIAALIFFQSLEVRAASVGLSATPTSRTVNQGQSAIYTININRDGYGGSVALSASNLPAGATASFAPNPTTGKSSVLTVTTKTTTPIGTFQLKIGGTASGVSIAPINLTLVVKAAPSVTLTGVPTTQSIIAGQIADYTININRTNYDGPVTLSATLPDGLSASFEPNPAYGNSSRMRIYTHLLPFTGRDYDIVINPREFEKIRVSFRLRVNCGLDWADQFAVSSDPASWGGDFATDVAVADDGSIYVTGDTIDPDTLLYSVWVAKYSSTGNKVWLTPLTSSGGSDHAAEIAVDASGNIFIGGYTDGTFPGNNSEGENDFWIAKFNDQGVQQWVTQDGTNVDDGIGGFEIVPDGAGGGKFVTLREDQTKVVTMTFAANNGTLTQQNSFPVDWSAYTNADGYEIFDLALDQGDIVYTVGKLNYLFGSEGWMVKYDNQSTSGNLVWSQITAGSVATRVITDPIFNGFAYAAGTDGDDAWVSQYNTVNGNTFWTQFERSSGRDVINALAINNSGDLVIAGMTEGVLGESRGNGNGNGSRFDDAWVSRRDARDTDGRTGPDTSDGSLKWIQQFAKDDIDGFSALAIDANNGAVLVGYTVQFKNVNYGYEDALILRYADSWTIFSPRINAANPFTPSNGTVGSTIRINGGNLFGITAVRFNGIPAAFTVPPNLTPAFSAIDAVVPPGAEDGVVTVSKECSCVTSTTNFDVR